MARKSRTQPQEGYVKPHDEIMERIQKLEKEIFNPKYTIHVKRDKMNWREALVWAITKDQNAFRKALAVMYSSKEYENLKRAEEQAKQDGEPGREIPKPG
jgi:hypothetical protein